MHYTIHEVPVVRDLYYQYIHNSFYRYHYLLKKSVADFEINQVKNTLVNIRNLLEEISDESFKVVRRFNI